MLFYQRNLYSSWSLWHLRIKSWANRKLKNHLVESPLLSFLFFEREPCHGEVTYLGVSAKAIYQADSEWCKSSKSQTSILSSCSIRLLYSDSMMEAPPPHNGCPGLATMCFPHDVTDAHTGHRFWRTSFSVADPQPSVLILQLCAHQEDVVLGSVYAICTHHWNDVIYLNVA